MSNLKLSQKQVVFIIAGAVLAIGIFALIFLNLRPTASKGPALTLKVWGTESSGALQQVIDTYPYAQVSYTQIDPAHYQSELLAALAAGNGPDVFEIGNRDLPRFEDILSPFPSSSSVFGIEQLSQLFPDVVAQDFVANGRIYGLPLSIDTLAMLYNKDLFNAAGIAEPPATWDEFDADVAKLRAVDAAGGLLQAGAAIGGSSASIPHAADLLALIMLQNGTTMTNSAGTSASFASAANKSPGLAAFKFYLQFANPASPYYTWNDSFPSGGNAFDSFAEGKTAIVFAYHSDLAAIKAKAPFLNYAVAPMPQLSAPPGGGPVTVVNYPKYLGFVAAKAGQTAAAWNFILYLTTPLSGDANAYGAATGNPPALRSAIAADENSQDLSVFASQALTARSWYEANSTEDEAALNTAIEDAENGQAASRALSEAEAAVSALMQ